MARSKWVLKTEGPLGANGIERETRKRRENLSPFQMVATLLGILAILSRAVAPWIRGVTVAAKFEGLLRRSYS
jgi:hypothetical protein